MHHHERTRQVKLFAQFVRYTVGAWNRPPIRRCKITIERHSAGLPDWDGLYGGLKPLLDVLVMYRPRQSPHGLGIILDDSPRVIRRLIAVPVKCQPNGGKTVITIDELSDG